MEETSSVVTMEEITLPRSRKAIEEDLNQVDEEVSQFAERFSHVSEQMDNLSEERRDVINGFIESHLEEDQNNERNPDVTLSDEEAILAEKMVEAVRIQQKLEQRNEKLQEELLPFRKKDLDQLIDDLSERTDYDAVMSYYGPDKNRTGSDILQNAVFELYQLRKYQYELNESVDVEHDYNFYDFRCETLESYKSGWEEKGFLKQSTEVEESSLDLSEETKPDRIKLLAEITEVVNQLDEFNHLAGIYQHTLTYSSSFDKSHSHLKSLSRILTPNGNSSGYDYFTEAGFDPKLIKAVKTQTEKLIAEHRVNGRLPATSETIAIKQQQIDAMDYTKLLAETKVVGLEKKHGLECTVSPEGLLDEVRTNIPPELLSGLKSLGYKENGGQVEVSNQGEIVGESIGEFIPTFDENGKMISTEIAVYKSPFVPEGLLSVDKLVSKSKFMSIVWHEFGHNAHHLMTYDEMIAWEDTMTKDKTAVTWYVEYSRNQQNIRGKREDFSESFMLYIDNPALLHTLSKERYEFMTKFVADRLQTDQKDTFNQKQTIKLLSAYNVWEKGGYTEEDIRNMYLGHEKEKEPIVDQSYA